MNFVMHELVILLVIAECCTQSLFPIHDGCSEPSSDISDPERCIHTLYCLNYVSSINGRHSQCSNLLVHPNGNNYDPISVVLKITGSLYDHSNTIFPRFQDSEDVALIYSLNLSDNNDAWNQYVPTLQYMENLAVFKMMRCTLETAKLSNENELPALMDIDYSENNIINIVVDPGEHVFKSLKKLNLSHNALVTIPDSTFDLFPGIESMDISHNFLFTLDIMSFEGIRKLLHLNLSYSRIASLESSLQRLRYLIKLDLSHNILTAIKTHDFAKLVNLQEIKLDYNYINTIEKHVFENMALLTTINLHENALDTIDQDIFINDTMLTSIYLSQNRLKVLPKHMFKGKTISDFKIEGNRLEGSLERSSFEGLGLVKELDLSAQHLTSVENYTFAELQNLQTLLLNNNDIEVLRNYSFKGLPNLNCLDLSYNKISKLDIVTEDLISLQIFILHHNKISHISSNNFIALGSLQLLDLSHNNISFFRSNYFHSLQNLQSFKISDNPLCGSIEEKTFDGLSSLPSLDISGTIITKVNNGSFMGMTLLRNLNISRNNIAELQYNALSYANNIRTVDLSYNKLTVIDVNITDLNNLDTLLLNNNMLQVLSPTLFNGLSLLRTVVLSHNHICSIHKETFYHLNDMRTLDLSYNPELEFDVYLVVKAKNLATLIISGTKIAVTFKDTNDLPITNLEMAYSNIQNVSRLNLYKLQCIETLVLSNNNASKLKMGDLSNLTSLNQLDLSYNNIDYIQPGTFKDNTYLKLLNISHNKLLEISHGIFQGLLYVEVIDLSFNRIKDLHQSRFYDAEQLTTLIVGNNEIEFISDDDFLGTRLSKLSIGGNPLTCKVLYNIKRVNSDVRITAINMDESKDNLKGVTCIKDGYNYNTKLMPEAVEQNKLLLDIRNVLYNITKGRNVKEPIASRYDSSYLESITKQEQELSQHSLEILSSIKKLSSISNLTSIINSNTNLLLGKILRVLTLKEALPTSKPIIVIKENATSDGIISYINKIKQDLEDTLAIEKQNVLELDEKIEKLNSKIVFSTKIPVHEKFVNTNEERQSSSIFTAVCVGLMLVILIVFILYKIYNSELYLTRGRSRTSSSSRRNIAECMESPQL